MAISPRADTGMAALTGLVPEALPGLRFETLIAAAERDTVTKAIEAVMAGGRACALSMTLQVDRAEPKPVRVGLAVFRPDFNRGRSRHVDRSRLRQA